MFTDLEAWKIEDEMLQQKLADLESEPVKLV